ncbi:MAG: hypothetical protein ABUK13_05580 [Gammaproteobacteria bacterium]
MNKEELIDEIDWLIFELKPGLELSVEHYTSFEAVGIDCPHATIGRSHFDNLTAMLKNKREDLI